MRIKRVGNKKDGVLVVIKNGEASASIPRGTPVVLQAGPTADNTDQGDGVAVTLPATAAAKGSGTLMYGVATQTLAANAIGESIIFGMVPYAILTRATRAATTDSWSASASLSASQILALDTVNNDFLIASASLGSTNFAPFAVLIDSLSAIAASASATSDARTVLTQSVRAFVRMM